MELNLGGHKFKCMNKVGFKMRKLDLFLVCLYVYE